jgi:hypothetical protein
MKTMASRLRWITLLACVSAPAAFGAVSKSDLVPKEKRETAIATGTRLARPGELPMVAADIVSPFNPPDFSQSDPESTAPKTGASAATTGAAAGSAGPRMSSAREILESLATLIPAKGTIQRPDGEWLLSIEGGRSFKVGDILNISQVGETAKYPFEITRISATDFTLRYQGEVKTRPIVIKPSSK